MIRPIITALLLALALVAGCAPTPQRPDSEEMYIKASALTKLAAAVESTVRYKNPPPELSESELLTLATQHDPVLLENFKGYKVRALQQDRHSVVLVCDASGAVPCSKTRAAPALWIVIAGWTSRSRASFRYM